MVSCRGSVAKFLLCLVNLIFIILAVIVILIGTRIQMSKDNNSEMYENLKFKSIASCFIFNGCALGIISIFGFAAAICESPLLLNIYVYFLALCCVALLALYTVLIFFSNQVLDSLRDYYKSVVGHMHSSVEAMYAVQKMQSMLYCCGLNSFADWRNRSFTNQSTLMATYSTETEYFPSSCCGRPAKYGDNNTIYEMCAEKEIIFFDGCFSQIQVARYRMFTRTLFSAIMLAMLLLLTLACCLERDRSLELSRIINLQYAAHLNSCRGSQIQMASQAGIDPSSSVKRSLLKSQVYQSGIPAYPSQGAPMQSQLSLGPSQSKQLRYI